MISSSMPIFAVVDVAETVKFYADVLGFSSNWIWGDPPSAAGASWGNVTLMFLLDPELSGRIEGQQHWFNVDDVDALHAQHRDRGANIISELEDKPWDRREYTVRDPNGYHLRFTGNPSHTSKGSGEFPEGVQIEKRMPTRVAFDTIAGAEFYRDGLPSEIYDRTWNGVLALGPNGEAIGVLRIMHDAPGWFSIWDVAVLPEWQGQRIGTAMMEAALEMIRTESPGASAHLFTRKQGFYDRLGFSIETVSMRKA